MIKILQIIFCSLIFNCCNSQTSENTSPKELNILTNEVPNGIVYFSADNGFTWVNTSHGLPEKTKIGLGGLATSNKNIGVATKDNGVYLFNFENKIWESVPTLPQIIEGNIGAMSIYEDAIFVGTQNKGVFYTTNKGKDWKNLNTGLTNTTIRRFCELKNGLYVCTNDGFYAFNKISNTWSLEFGQNSLQTNGATLFKERFYLATNKGIFSQQPDKSWINSSPQLSMHNISSDKNLLYAMTYNELLLSSTDGNAWQSWQTGLPKKLYTFNVLYHNNQSWAGQWDGIYKRNVYNTIWELSSNGLPAQFAVTNLKAFHDILVISTSERKLKEGMSTTK